MADEPRIYLSADRAAKHRAQAVHPLTALRVAGQDPIRPAVFSGEQMLVRGAIDDSDAYRLLQETAGQQGLQVEVDPGDARVGELIRALQLVELPAAEIVSRVRLTPKPGTPTAPPEPWLILQTFQSAGQQDQSGTQAGLEHLVGAHEHVNGSPFIIGLEHVNGSPYVHGLEHVNGSPAPDGTAGLLAEYGVPGAGGRTPAAWVGPRPPRLDDEQLVSRRPVVAILDTGVGVHPWLGDDIVEHDLRVAGLAADQIPEGEDPEKSGVVTNPLTGELDTDSGHGTFIAGLVRQTCPDADIVAVRIMRADGVVAEGDLINALYLLLARQVIALRNGDASKLIDVVTLSLGYYHEQVGDKTLDPMLLAPIRALGSRGVTVVASAGNDATERPTYPAAFTPHAGGPVKQPEADVLPVISVGALNPDGSIALFSNDGPWVTAYRAGAALVSTMPTTFDGGATATVVMHGPGGYSRGTLDPDDFKGGFATWSGTSFAVPIVAGQIAQQLIDDGKLDARPEIRSGQTLRPAVEAGDGVAAAAAAVDRGWTALAKTLANDKRPLRRPAESRPGTELPR